jgi:hypothetical protein
MPRDALQRDARSTNSADTGPRNAPRLRYNLLHPGRIRPSASGRGRLDVSRLFAEWNRQAGAYGSRQVLSGVCVKGHSCFAD